MFDRLETALREAESAMAEVDPKQLIGTQPSVGVDLLIRHERVTAAARLAMVARAEEMHPWQREGFRSFEDWLAAKQGTSHGQARRRARTARRLADRDKTADALAGGEISEDEADVIADAADKNPAAEQELLDTAKNRGRSHDDLKKKAADAKAAGEDDRARADRLRRGRRAGWGVDREGFWTLSGRFEPHVGAEMKAHLAAEADRIFEQARREGTSEPHDRCRADAVANLIRGTAPDATERTSDTPAATGAEDAVKPGDGGSAARTDAAASASDLAGSSAGHRPADAASATGTSPAAPSSPAPSSSPSSRSDRPPSAWTTDGADRGRPTRVNRELILDINLEALRRGCVNPGERSTVRGVGPVPVEIARQWADDAFIKAVIRDGEDVRLVAHFGRHIPAPLRTALGIVDTTCAVPGCSNPRIEYDHDIPHADHGVCSTSNLRPLCVHHHRQRTHDGYELRGPPGNRIWTGPDGTVLFADDAGDLVQSMVPPRPTGAEEAADIAGPTSFADADADADADSPATR